MTGSRNHKEIIDNRRRGCCMMLSGVFVDRETRDNAHVGSRRKVKANAGEPGRRLLRSASGE